jgi:hypothetical protein
MEHIGKYKGYEVYKVPRHEMEYNSGKTLYAVAETGELVLKGEVVGKVNFNSGSVTEYDDHKCYEYKYPRKEEPKPKRGKRAEVVTPDMVLSSQVVDPTDLDKLINEFIIAARSMTIEDYVGEFKAEV